MFILNDFSTPEKKGKNKTADEEVFVVDAEDFETIEGETDTMAQV